MKILIYRMLKTVLKQNQQQAILKKRRVAVAIARAKAKKQEKEQQLTEPDNSEVIALRKQRKEQARIRKQEKHESFSADRKSGCQRTNRKSGPFSGLK
ncbi:hypothetical protein ACLKMH_08580 [Psychromonas sp. KJ10-10]|uniref:hypothetical protein n=1 Tax=Psychromonas sp. KJ10-10 TaxID=3391823 RepID=UPI0039B4356A